jgi:hypothetical protein
MLTARAGVTALALVLASSFAMAQSQTPPAKSAPAGTMKQETKQDRSRSTTSSATDSVKQGAEDVKNWTEKQWNSMKAEWRKNKAQWNSCNDQAKAKHLKGKESWSFFYDCMKA